MSKAYEEATKEFYSSVSKRTRSRRDAYFEIAAETHIPSFSRRCVQERKRRRQTMPTSGVGGRAERSAESSRNVKAPSEKPFATVEIPAESVSPRLAPRGNGNKASDSKEIWFERIDKAEFISEVSFSMSKVGSSKNGKSNGRPSATAPRKADSVSKQATSAGYSATFGPKDGPDRAWTQQSSSFVLIESDSDDEKTQSDQVLCAAASRKNADRRNISPADASVSFPPPRDYGADFDTFAFDSTKLPEKAKHNRHGSFSEIKTKGNGKGLLKINKPFTKQGCYSTVSSMKEKEKTKNADTAKGVPFYSYCGTSSKNAGRDSHKNAEDYECERLDEAEAEAELRRKRQFASEVGSSTGEESDKECIGNISKKNPGRGRGGKGSTRKDDRHQKRRKVSDSTRNKHVDCLSLSSNESESGDSFSKSEFSCSGANASLQDSEVSCYGGEHKQSVGVANRTRAKVGGNKKPAQAGKVSLDSSADSDSSSTDSGDDSLDENFEPGSSDNDIEFLGSHIEESDVQEENEETESKEAAPPSNSKDVDDHINDLSDDGAEEKTEATSSYSLDCAVDKTAGEASREDVQTESKEAAPPSNTKDLDSSCSVDCAVDVTAEMASREDVQSGSKEAAPPSNSKDLNDHMDDLTEDRKTGATSSPSHVCEETKTSGMADEKKMPSEATEAAPDFHSNDLCDHTDYGAEESNVATVSPARVPEKNKTSDVANEKMMPSKVKEAAPDSHSKDLRGCANNDTEERIGETSSRLHVREKNKTSDIANEKMMPSKVKEKAPDSHIKDLRGHTNDDTEERIGVTSSRLHVCAKKKIEDSGHEKMVPSKPKKAAPQPHIKDVRDHTNDGIVERIGETSSRLNVRAKKRIEDNTHEKKVPPKAKEAAPRSHLKDLYAHTNDGTEERTRETSSRSHVRSKEKIGEMANEKTVPQKEKEAAPSSLSKVLHRHTEDGTKERNGAAISSLHEPAQNETSDKPTETEEVPTGKKEAVSPSHSKDLYNRIGDSTEEMQNKSETAEMSDEAEIPTGIEQASSRKIKDLFSVLADAVLGRGLALENKEINEEVEQAPGSPTQDTLPLKFRFEDEVPEVVEKTEYEKEIDDLFCELERELELDELQSFDYAEDDVENVNSPPEETQHARCCRGRHELVLEDEEGLICIFCRHVAIGPKDIMPEWAEITYRESGRKRCTEREQPLDFDELHLHSSTSDDAGDGNSAYGTGTVWSIKPGVRESMYEHQREGFEFLWKNLAGSIDLEELRSNEPVEVGGCIISHAPGTGKTRLTIVFVETYLKMFPKCMPVIISPASTLLTWEEEFKKWSVDFPFHNLSNTELSGKENKTALRLLPWNKIRDSESIRMMKICSWSMGGSILGISYNLFEKLTGEKNRKGNAKTHKKIRKILLEMPGLVVLDEGHTPRNQRSSIWNVLLKLQTQKRVILSGTPFQNNFAELFNTLRIVRPAKADMLAQEKTFAEMVAPRRPSSSRRYKAEASLISDVVDRAVEKLKLCISPFVHLHKGTILQQNLPGLRDCVVLLNPPTLQKSLIERIEGSNNFKHEHEIAMISVHPYLFLRCETSEDRRSGVDIDAIEASKLNSQEGVKTRFLLELVRLSMAVKEKILVFSQYIDPLELIKEQLKEVFNWVEGKQVLHLQGRQYQKQRQVLINLFNDPQSESKIMLASTKCCAEGISLVGASRVVLLDVVWNPSVERQAICRAYRIGQKKFVHTYHLMTSGTTEADKYCRQAEKERLSELVFSSSNESNQRKELSSGIEDRILEVMVANESLKGMFEKIINQPKGTDLIQTFGLTS